MQKRKLSFFFLRKRRDIRLDLIPYRGREIDDHERVRSQADVEDAADGAKVVEDVRKPREDPAQRKVRRELVPFRRE